MSGSGPTPANASGEVPLPSLMSAVCRSLELKPSLKNVVLEPLSRSCSLSYAEPTGLMNPSLNDSMSSTGDNVKKQKTFTEIPGLDGAVLDPQEPMECVLAPVQYPEELLRYRYIESLPQTFLIAFPTGPHAMSRGLSFLAPGIKLVGNVEEAWDRCVLLYPDEQQRLQQWEGVLRQLEAGAHDDALAYRKLIASYTPIMMPPYEGRNTRLKKVTVEAVFATSYTKLHWSSEQIGEIITDGTMPAGYNRNIYLQESRRLLTQERQEQQQNTPNAVAAAGVQKMIVAGVGRKKRDLEVKLEYDTLSKEQLVKLLEEREKELAAVQQELHNYEKKEGEKNTYKGKYNDLTVGRAREVIEQRDLMISNLTNEIAQTKLELAKAQESSKGAEEIQQLEKQAKVLEEQLKNVEEKHEGLMERVTAIEAENGELKEKNTTLSGSVSSEHTEFLKYKTLWQRSVNARNLEVEAGNMAREEIQELRTELTRIEAERHDDSMMDEGWDPKKSLHFSDMRSQSPKREERNAKSHVMEDPSVSPVPLVPDPVVPVDSPGALVREKELQEVIGMYMDREESIITHYHYGGAQLELLALINRMDEIYAELRVAVDAYKAGDRQGSLEVSHLTEGLQLLDLVGRDHMRAFISYYGQEFSESRCGRCGEYPGTIGGKHGYRNGDKTDCPHGRENCQFCKLVFALVPNVNEKMNFKGNEIHPTGFHVTGVCPYMKLKFQKYLGYIVTRLAKVRKVKEYQPMGGMAVGLAKPVSRNGGFDNSLSLF